MTGNKRSIFYLYLVFNLFSFAQIRNQAYLSYIEQYYPLAVKQQKEHNIPASIVLAQGLLESGAGKSDFARQSNNHFGIKCNTDWKGDRIFHDDDEKGECFRKYDQVIDSYEDHASFLKNRPRYAFLFKLSPIDYEAWAHGLKKAGYATDPSYPFKLISIIEDYNLHRLDIGNYAATSMIRDNSSAYTASMGTIEAKSSHSVFRVNAVKFVISLDGDTYAKIAEEFNMDSERVCEYNEVDFKASLAVGIRVFIEQKKSKAPKECETHVVQEAESMYSISQDYAIKIENLYQLNKIPYTEGVSFGQILKLR